MLVEAYAYHALSRSQCFRRFEKFRVGNFDLENETRGRPPKKFEDTQLELLLEEDDSQTQGELAERLGVDQSIVSRRLQASGMIQKLSK